MTNFTNWITKAENQEPIYKATVFWNKAIKDLIIDIEEFGIESFRRWPSSCRYFVPNYNNFENKFKKLNKKNIKSSIEILNLSSKQENIFYNLTNGYTEAEGDYRVFKSSILNTKNDFLLNFSESKIGQPKEQFVFEGQTFSRSGLNYLLGLACLGKFIDLENIKTIIEIGGGFGTLGEIVAKTWPKECKYLNFDIPPICNISDYYLRSIVKSFVGINKIENYEKFSWDNLNTVNVAANWKVKHFNDKIDLFVNFISFQEMEPKVIKNYFYYILKMQPKFILLRHIREGKQKLTLENEIGVLEPTTPIIYKDLLKNYQNIYSDAIPFGKVTHDHFHSDVLIFKRM